MDRLTFNYVWNQKPIPVVLRRTGRVEKLRVGLPFADDNRQWLQNGLRTAPGWVGGANVCWEVPQSWFNDFVDRPPLQCNCLPATLSWPDEEKEPMICARRCL